jgi:hypothetical protein
LIPPAFPLRPLGQRLALVQLETEEEEGEERPRLRPILFPPSFGVVRS